MEQPAMVYDNPSAHSGLLRDRSDHPVTIADAGMRTGDREAAIRGMPARSSDPLLELVGSMRMGAILVSREGRVAYLNDGGKEALDSQIGLALRGDLIVATAPDTRRRFSQALNNACAIPYVDGSLLLHASTAANAADLVAAGSASGTRRALRVVSMERLMGSHTGNHAGRAASGYAAREPHVASGLALLCIACSRSRPPEATMLGQLFGLTAAESALMAAVAGGERLHACAARRGVSLATVRAQLRNVFVKTGAATQSELTFIAWSIPGLWIA